MSNITISRQTNAPNTVCNSTPFDSTNLPVLNYGSTTTPWHIKNLRVSFGRNFKYTFPTNTFTDPDPGDSLTYSATLKSREAILNWLTFNQNTAPSKEQFQGCEIGKLN